MWFESAYTFLGGLGIFFLGLKSLSESLQAIAGDVIRRVIRATTSKPIMGVLVGTLVTTIVQSSSVTTVMVVSLVNASLMTLTQAISVIFGANVGTTITGWIIAIKIGKYGLLLVGLGAFPMIFAENQKFKQLGKIVLALGLVFMGLEFMSGAFKPLRSAEGFLTALKYFSADNVFTLMACVLVGAAFTCVIQSSSAMLGITIALAASGSITFQTAAALGVGANIGTTITAILASVGTNTNAKRAARAHAAFNILAVVYLLPLFWVYIDLVDSLVAGSPDAVAADGSKPNVATHIAAAHTIFNVANAIIFLPFVNHLARFVTWITPGARRKETPHLRYLPGIDVASPPLALAAAEKELTNLSGIIQKSLSKTRDYVLASKPSVKGREAIFKYEKITDNLQEEMTVFLCKIQEASLSSEQAQQAYGLIRAADELESISDYCSNLVRYRDRLQALESDANKDALHDLKRYLDELLEFYSDIDRTIQASRPWDIEAIGKASKELKETAEEIRGHHRVRLEKRKLDAVAGMHFSDLMIGMRKMRGHMVNVAEVLAGRYHTE